MQHPETPVENGGESAAEWTMKTCTRKEAIADLREALIELAGEQRSICYVATRMGIFCNGFAQWDLEELKAQYPEMTRGRTRLSRAEVEELADRWQMARQFVTGERLACDVQIAAGEEQTCKGWDEFDDDALSRFHLDICGEEVLIVDAPSDR